MTKQPKHLIVAVDRIEGSQVVLEGDNGRVFVIPVSALADPPHEGLVYTVPLAATGEPSWKRAIANPAESERRKRELGARMERLHGGDGGGDTKL